MFSFCMYLLMSKEATLDGVGSADGSSSCEARNDANNQEETEFFENERRNDGVDGRTTSSELVALDDGMFQRLI